MIVSGSTFDNEMGIIPNVNIQVVGENRSTTSDEDGRFTIAVNSNDSVLRFSHAGFDYDEATVSKFLIYGYINLYPVGLDDAIVENNYKEDNTLLYVIGLGVAFLLGKVIFSNNPKAVNVKA